MNAFTRRDFLKASGLGAAALTLAACGDAASTGSTSTGSTASTGSTSTSGTDTTAPAAGNEPEAAVDGCTAPEASDITVLTSSDMVTFFPIDTANTLDGGIQKLMTDGLVCFDKDSNIVWMLATDYEPNDDATRYVFHLRQGVSFQDGTPWNAEAAKANFDIAINQENGYKKNANFKMIDNCEIIDEYTIALNLKYPFGAMLNYLAHPSALMVSPKQISENYDAIPTEMSGCGQYSLKEWRPGESWVIELNRDWWGYKNEICGGEAIVPHEAGFSSITFTPIKETATRVASMMNGEAQFAGAPAQFVDALQGAGLSVEYTAAGLGTSYIYFNCQKAVFSDKRVRQAVVYGIDLDALIAVSEGGVGTRSTSFITPAISYYKANEPTKYDVDKAKALLAEAGYPNGFEAVMWSQNSTAAVTRAEFIQQQLANIGITLKVVPCEAGVLSSGVSGYSGDPKVTEFDCYLRGWSSSTADADQGLGRFATSMWTPVGTNYAYYSNEEFDAAVAEGGSTADPEKRAAAYAKAQDILWDEFPCVCLFDTKDGYVYDSSKVAGLCYYPDGGYFFREGCYIG